MFSGYLAGDRYLASGSGSGFPVIWLVTESFWRHSGVIPGFAVWIQRQFGAGLARRSSQTSGGEGGPGGSDPHQAGR